MFKFAETKLKGLYIVEPEPFQDGRGKFYRVFCKNEFKKINHNKEIVQINKSLTTVKGALRGMHFQYPPKAEIKLVKCIAGSVFDVAIDLRKDSPTFLQWHSEILSLDNMKMMYIPEGFAHGFQTLDDNTQLIYFHTEFYSLEHEGSINYKDPKINIKWPLEITELSEKDKNIKYISNDFKGIEI